MPAPRNRLYVGNTPFTATETDIKEFFSGFNITEVKIITDRETGRPRGFCFVEVSTADEQKKAIETLNNQQMNGRRITVSEAKEKERRPNSGGLDRRDNARDRNWE